MINVTRASLPDIEEYIDEISEIWDNHWLTNMGPKHKKFQKELTDYLNVPYVELLVNGHMALELSLQALNLQGEVITTPFTFASTTHAIVRNGLKPVFCDINSSDYTINTEKIESLINDRTSAIMPVHVYGNICNIEEIERISKKYGLKVIYDAAHAFGEKYKGKSVAEFGDISCFSFHATKVFNTIEGGCACYRDKEIGKTLFELKNFGIQNPEEVSGVGANAKMNEFCAAMGICNLKHIKENINARRYLFNRYIERFEGVEGIDVNRISNEVDSNYSYFPIIIEPERFGSSREEVYIKLKNNGIVARKYFYPLTNTFSCFHKLYDVSKTPVALHISKRVLTLPLYAELNTEDVDRIADIVLSCKI